MSEFWMMSNRQPWVEALLRGLITTKTRDHGIPLPPVGATVFLHAGKQLWDGWQFLGWIKTQVLEMSSLPVGGVCGVAKVRYRGPTRECMPAEDRPFFEYAIGGGSCAGVMCVVFEDVRRMQFVPCRGTQRPTRRIPEAVIKAYEKGCISSLAADQGIAGLPRDHEKEMRVYGRKR